LSEGFGWFSGKYKEGLFSAISAGFFFVLVGAIFMVTPNLLGRIIDFFGDFDLMPVPNIGIWLPAPAHPWIHSVVYTAVEQLSYIWGLFQIVVLALRFVMRSPWNKKAETSSNLVFWLGAGFLIRTFLIDTTRYFVFWAGIIMLMGVAIIIRAIVQAAAPAKPAT